MPALPDDALVVRGGENLPESFALGSGVTVDLSGKVQGVSVNAAPGLTVTDLTAPNAKMGYPGIPHNQVGVTTVGRIRAHGGVVDPSPRKKNPNHATLSGLTPEQASSLFRPTVKNPRRTKETE
ncbi:MAG: flavoredoxin [Planctomycetes bacterium]|nr:flavoredoxin [Planctomycetota bacterium]